MTALETHTQPTFEQTWDTPRGVIGALSAVNGIPLGKRFMITALVFFALGGVLALFMRVQLAVPDNQFLGPEMFNRLFTMHGSTMMYLFAVPFLEGLAIYLLPLMLGSRDLAFPRLTAFGYWTYLFGGLVFYASFIFGAVPDVGWFAYTPLSGPRFAGRGVDFWLLGLSLVELAGITAGIEIVVTILKLRAPGMSLSRLPLFVWAILTAAIMIVFAFTTLLTATVMLEMDRTMGTRFFDPARGGSSLLWQHLFWFFGHPEVYIIFLPATGIVSMVVAAFAGRIAGYVLIVVAIIVTAFLSFGLWVHHMYATGLPELSMHFFAAASLMIAIASGTQVFAWIASLWGSRSPLKTPLMFVLGFLFIFVIGGLTGVMVAVVPFDWQVHDTYFIVAHFHYVLIGGALFPIFAGLHYWVPKITGRMLGEGLGQTSFWLSFIGFNVTFFPMHIMGFEGMPRRVYTYLPVLNLGIHNFIATVGAFVLAGGFIAFVANVAWSMRNGRRAGRNPWGSDSLEWLTSSPPPPYCHDAPPVVRSRHPLWTDPEARGRGNEADPPGDDYRRLSETLARQPEQWRASLATDVVTGEPQSIQWLPGPSYLPILVAIGLLVGSAGVIAQAYLLLPVGVAFSLIVLVAWLRPRDEVIEVLRDSDLPQRTGLPIFTTGPRSIAWWGMIGTIATLATILGVLLYSYFYVRLYSEEWPQGNLPRPRIWLPLLWFVLVPAGAGAHVFAGRSLRENNTLAAQFAMGGAVAAGTLFVAIHLYALAWLTFAPSDNAYASLFYTLGWILDLFVLTGAGLSAGTLYRFIRHPDERDQAGPLPLMMQLSGLYWYFLAAAAVVVYLTLQVSPYVI